MKLTAILFLLTTYFVGAHSKDTITTASGLKYFFTQRGDGVAIDSGTVVFQHYTVWLTNGDTLDSSRPRKTPFVSEHPSTELIKGTNEVLSLMKVGDRGIFILPPHIAYGENGKGPVPPNATLIFDIEIMGTLKSSVRNELINILYNGSYSVDSIPNLKETLTLYKSMKQKAFADLYSRGVADLIFVGKRLLDKHPAEAAEVFMLNSEAYPNSGKTFDLYAEALLKMGDTISAIENYKRSIDIHPGNQNALKVLNALGVNTEGLVKDYDVEDALLQSYVGRYQLTPQYILTVYKEGRQMTIVVNGETTDIFPAPNHVFYMKVAEAQIVFNLNASGQVESLSVFQDEDEIKGYKLDD
ncbi:uncharacterized protein DUF3471 [Flavobacteriaceae bacterium MAR_2010_105]|nr:uncharacterized protein DUF3471 [Flavobacteriaceae bacterium MAR_2010_105]